MPVSNPYDFSGALGSSVSGGNPGVQMMGQTLSGPGASPYGGMLGYVQRQRQDDGQRRYADTMTQLRALIQQQGQGEPQGGALTHLPTPAPGAAPAMDDPDGYYSGVGSIENGGRDNGAVNPASGAAGRYQFIQPTWASVSKEAPELGLTPEGRAGTDPESVAQQQRAMQHLTKQNSAALTSALQRPPSRGELYLAHFLGPGYATSVLRNPETPVDALVPESFVKANPMLKGISGKDLLSSFERRFAR